jgi:hypothetical protein
MKVLMILMSMSLSSMVLANGARGKQLSNRGPAIQPTSQQQQEKGPHGRHAIQQAKKGKLDISDETQKRKRKGE